MKNFIVSFIIIIFCSSNLFSSTIYVSKSGDNTTGTSWETAFNNLQSVIDNHKSALDIAVSGDQIWVAAGIYLPEIKIWGSTDRNVAFKLVKGVAIYGGFNGTETELTQRNISINETILSGNIGDTASSVDNCYHVIYNLLNTDLDSTAILDGFTIKNGQYNGLEIDSINIGGLLFCSGVSPTIRNCNFNNNGYNIYIGFSNNKTLFENCNFKLGSILNKYSNIEYSNCKFNNCSSRTFYSTIKSNNSQIISSNVYLNHSTLIANYINLTGNTNNAMIIADSSEVNFTNSLFANINGNSILSVYSNIDIRNCTFTDNFNRNSNYNYSNKNISSGINLLNHSVANIYNSILWKNKYYNTELYNSFRDISILSADSSVVNLFNSCSDNEDIDSTSQISKQNCVASDPNFIESGIYPYSLYGISPCINSGNNSYSTAEIDIRGEVRINTNGISNDSIIDMGAYEYSSLIDPFQKINKIIYVNQSAQGTADGLSWETAFNNLQSALDCANRGDEIRVAKGTYYPTKSIDSANTQIITFQMKRDVAIYGGFVGNETEREQRNYLYNKTIISGNIGNTSSVIDDSPVLFYHPEGLGLDSTAILDGFYLENKLGIMVNIWNSPKLVNCHIRSILKYTNNQESLLNYSNCNSIISNCKFEQTYNTINNIGGALLIENCEFVNFMQMAIYTDDTKLTVKNSKFYRTIDFFDNSENRFLGQAIYSDRSSITIDSCSFDGIFSERYGLITIFSSQETNISNSRFVSNFTFGYSDYMIQSTISIIWLNVSVNINNCLFENNISENGAAISINRSDNTVKINNCRFINNKAEYSGGAIFNNNTNDSLIKISNSVFYGNSANYASAIFGNCELTNCSIGKNISTNDGAAIIAKSIKAYNSIIIQNSTANGTNDIQATDLKLYNCLVSDDTTNVKANTSIKENCIDANPFWVLQGDYPLILTSQSSAIDAGNNIYTDSEFDLRGTGYLRKLNKDGSANGIVDMGAYEFDINSPKFQKSIIFVTQTAQGNADGTSWENSLGDVQQAIDSCYECKEIWVARGTYYPTKKVAGNNESNRAFSLPSGIAIIGGFIGDEHSNDNSNWRENRTVLSGNIGSSSTISDNCNHIFYNIGTENDIKSELRGLIFSGGFSIKSSSDNTSKGVTIYNYKKDLSIKDCIFENNSSVNGSIVYNLKDSSDIASTEFVNNIGWAFEADSSFANFDNCKFIREDDTFSEVRGIIISQKSSINISDCRFNGLTSDYAGVVVNSTNKSSAFIDFCKINDNFSKGYDLTKSYVLGGAAVYSDNSNIYLSRTKFENNYCEGSGGAVWLSKGGGYIANSLFDKNHAKVNGGAIYNDCSNFNIINCTITENNASGHGGAIYNTQNSLEIYNSIIVNNYASDFFGIDIYNTSDSVLLQNCCYINKNSQFYGDFKLDSCITSDPIFALNGKEPYRLSKSSPCIDAGSDEKIYGKTDIRGDGFQRSNLYSWAGITYDCDIDIGAYEYNAQFDSITASNILYVNMAATGKNDGSSWQNAFVNLQDAIDNAASGNEIWTAQGTYFPTKKFGGNTDRHRAFSMKAKVEIYGGFNGTETMLSQAEPQTYLTVLSGDIGEVANKFDNCYHVFYHLNPKGLDYTSVLNGFTISGGYCIDDPINPSGAAMLNNINYPLIKNCKFVENYAVNGGAVSNIEANPEFNNCYFSNSATTSGGSISNYNSYPVFNNCRFVNNSSDFHGGAIYNNSSNMIMDNCYFYNSNSKLGGAIYNSNSSEIIIKNSKFRQCTSTNSGGTIANNSSNIYIYNTIIDSSFSVNGSAVYSFGGTSNIYNSLLSDNKSETGTLFNEYHGNILLVNCTIADNTADKFSGGLFSRQGVNTIGNSIFWNNINKDELEVPIDIYNIDGEMTITNSCFKDLTENVKGDYNTNSCIDADPLFVQMSGYKYILNGTSRCVDAGDNSLIDEQYDIRGIGYPRKKSKSGSSYGTVDIGAFEYQSGIDPISSIDYSDNYYSMSIYPNPVNDNSNIKFTTIENESIELYICDILSNKVLTIYDNQIIESGTHSIILDIGNLQSGTYYAVIKSKSRGSVVKFVIKK